MKHNYRTGHNNLVSHRSTTVAIDYHISDVETRKGDTVLVGVNKSFGYMLIKRLTETSKTCSFNHTECSYKLELIHLVTRFLLNTSLFSESCGRMHPRNRVWSRVWRVCYAVKHVSSVALSSVDQE